MSELNAAISSFASAAEVICALDSEGNFISVSLGSERLWGFSAKELLGTWLGSLVAPQDNRVALRGFKEALHGKEVPPFEASVVCRDGAELAMLWSMTLSEDRVVCIAHDISRRKRTELLLRISEARSRLVIESLPVGLVITNEDGVIELANPSAEAMFQLDLGALLGKNLDTLMRRSSTDSLGRLPRAKPIEVECQRRDETIFPVEITVNEFAGASEMNLVITLMDITDRQEIDRLKRELLSMIRHDLGGPLTAVQAVLSMLEENVYGALPAQPAEAIAMANGEIGKLVQLMDRLVGVTKMGAATSELNQSATPFAAVLVKALEQCRGLADEKQLSFILPETNPMLYIDPKQINQVLTTVFSTICERSEEQSILRITGETNEQQMTLGISSSNLLKPNEKGKKATIAHHQSDLSMAICKSIIERHGGIFTTIAENGDAFELSLPLLIE